MATKKKMLMSAAGNAGGGGLDITDVFSTYLYNGNSSAQTITNGIDLAGEGGLWWLKVRSQAGSHALYDSTRATGSEHFPLFSNNTSAEYDDFDTAPTSTGFTINSTSSGTVNETGQDYVSWSWRKAPKFFTCLTYTGNGVAGRTISHDLGTTVGMLVVKRTDSSASWVVYHKGLNGGTNPEQYYTLLDSTAVEDQATTVWNDTAPTSSEFTVGTSAAVNNHNNATYVAYLFAHNDGDGEFGPDGDQDIIKCGSYTGNGSSTGPVIDLGFEPQWLMIKGSSIAKEWRIFDVMRGMPVGGSGAFLEANSIAAEQTDTGPVALSANGFQLTQGGSETNNNNDTYIYMAIRRGPLAVPEDATDVFALQQDNAPDNNVPAFRSNFPVDAAFSKNAAATSVNFFGSRLIGANYLRTNDTNAEAANTDFAWDYMNGWNSEPAQGSSVISYMWKRAPGYFDVVAWNTENTANRRLDHNLTVTPEMAWVKSRDYVESWYVYHKDVGSNGFLSLNEDDDNTVTSALWPSPSATEFGIRENAVWNTGTAMIGYFFATLDGISKVGSFTGNGSNQTINCGFTSGASFILIKRTDANGNWVIFDSLRGIVGGNSPYILLNDTQAENANIDVVDPDSSGFIINQETQNNLNVNGGNYIFYAIA
jgi:hypothetical protein